MKIWVFVPWYILEYLSYGDWDWNARPVQNWIDRVKFGGAKAVILPRVLHNSDRDFFCQELAADSLKPLVEEAGLVLLRQKRVPARFCNGRVVE